MGPSATEEEFNAEFCFDGFTPTPSKKFMPITNHKPDIVKNIHQNKKIKKFIEKQKLSFSDLNLSKPLLKGLSTLNFYKPTPIQAKAVDFILKGRDVCACAATGSGKTIAYILPIFERFYHKMDDTEPATRVLILVPTRELGLQVYQVANQFSQFISNRVSIALCVGGLNIKTQEQALRRKPEIVIATPGRLIDHIQNSPDFNLSTVEILVLDEADRMLDEFFAVQMVHILNLCNTPYRQTLLFSATMTEKINDLARITLKDPIKIFVNSNITIPETLRQEFIRIRQQREEDREAILAALLTRNLNEGGVLVFVQTRVQTHRLATQLKLLGFEVGELHGNLKQHLRIEALKNFKEGSIQALICTDLASRGLDIPTVNTVVNFTLPNNYKLYVHRVGRTARAGKIGNAISLVGDNERVRYREIIKNTVTTNNNEAYTRRIDPSVITDFRNRLDALEEKISTALKAENFDKHLDIAERRIHKAQKIIDHQAEILKRPKRTWFLSHRERLAEEKRVRLDIRKPTKGDKESIARHRKQKKSLKEDMKLTPAQRIEKEIAKAKLYALKCLELDEKKGQQSETHSQQLKPRNSKITKTEKTKSKSAQKLPKLTTVTKKRKITR